MTNPTTAGATAGIDLDKLEALARVATPGPWSWWTSNSFLRLTGADGRDGGVLCPYYVSGHADLECSAANQGFIAAANPATMLQLIALARRAPAPADERADRYPLTECQPGQWWLQSLDALAGHGTVDDDTRRAAGIACNFAAAVFAHQAASAQPSAANATASEGGSKCQYPNCGCTSRATCNYNYDRAAPRNAHADDSLKANSLDGQNAADLANKSTAPTSDQQAGAVAKSDEWYTCPSCITAHFQGWQPKCMRCNKAMPQPSAAPAAIEQVGAQPVAWLKFWAAQYSMGEGNIGVDEGLEVCNPGEIGMDGRPAFPVYGAPAAIEQAGAQPVAQADPVDQGHVLRTVRRLLDGTQPKDITGAISVIDNALNNGIAWSYDIAPPQGFVSYVKANYSGDVHFHDPEWHAVRLWNAAMKNVSSRLAAPTPATDHIEDARAMVTLRADRDCLLEEVKQLRQVIAVASIGIAPAPATDQDKGLREICASWKSGVISGQEAMFQVSKLAATPVTDQPKQENQQ